MMRRNWKSSGIAVVAILSLTITAAIGPAASAGDEIARTAGSKKCLKKAKKIQDPVKRKKAKKKCRKKKGLTGMPYLRATLRWTGGVAATDLDLYVFDPSGATASSRAGSNPIPNTTFSGNAIGPSGTETFTDLIAIFPGAREFKFGVCHQEDGGWTGGSYTIEWFTADGNHHHPDPAGSVEGSSVIYTDSAIPPAYNAFTCPAP